MAYQISNREIKELKQTMGFRVDGKLWAAFADSHPEGCTDADLISFVKDKMDPPYEVDGSLDDYLNNNLKLFVEFINNRA